LSQLIWFVPIRTPQYNPMQVEAMQVTPITRRSISDLLYDALQFTSLVYLIVTFFTTIEDVVLDFDTEMLDESSIDHDHLIHLMDTNVLAVNFSTP
jgi:hypothetical protein